MSAAGEDWDDELAAEVIGKLILVGVTFCSRNGSPTGKEQVFGRAISAHPEDGVELALEGDRLGTRYTIPPALTWLERAERGIYTIQATGEQVVDPDFTIHLTVTQGTDA